ncbi:MAG: hypothetical protein EA379_02055 [Phycisphaerales bacterium]|nr:MAG: hypothetical protein EA379_02055 [Phycisphaerales bacterium]
MPRAVLLHHELPDGTSHFDWLLERVGGEQEGRCPTWRVSERIDRGDAGRFSAERLPDHRTFYLTHEGPVSGGRGEVMRVASGVVREMHEAPEMVTAVVAWDTGATVAYRGEPTGDGQTWVFRATPTD